MTARRARTAAIVVFPALAIAVSVACSGSPQVPANASSSKVVSAQAVSATSVPNQTVPAKTGAATTALQLLGRITVARERPAGYNRALFKHWIDADRDSCNTREEVLISESLSPPQVDAFGCKVIAGDWFSPYDGVSHSDPAELDIDHVVALKEAWDSGAHAWSASRRQSFANDLTSRATLIAVTAGVNRSKSDKDPSNWMPPRKEYWCTYLADWVAIKSRWGLSMDQSEHGRIRNILRSQCAGPSVGTDSSTPPSQMPSQSPSQRTTGSTTPVDSTPSPNTGGGDSLPAPTKGAQITVKPGAFCAPVGATGVAGGRNYVCSKTNAAGEPYSGDRARWRQG